MSDKPLYDLGRDVAGVFLGGALRSIKRVGLSGVFLLCVGEPATQDGAEPEGVPVKNDVRIYKNVDDCDLNAKDFIIYQV